MVSYIWHFSQQVLSSKLEFVVPTNIRCYHGNNEVRTLIKVVLEHLPCRSTCMPDLSGGQKFLFPTLFDFYREVFLNATLHVQTHKLKNINVFFLG